MNETGKLKPLSKIIFLMILNLPFPGTHKKIFFELFKHFSV